MNPISEEDCYYEEEGRETYGAVRESGGGSGGGGGGGSSSATTSRRCEECGNQAKKGCEYNRCRTCCKSRGFHCQTHVKSTWIPLSQRQTHHSRLHHQQQYQHLQRPSNPKRYRQNPPPSGSEDGNFPAEVHIPATFRCLRVNSGDNVVDQYAYQTEVEIGGHIFKGVLYDQGLESAFLIHPQPTNLISSSAADPIITSSNPIISPLDSFMPSIQPYP